MACIVLLQSTWCDNLKPVKQKVNRFINKSFIVNLTSATIWSANQYPWLIPLIDPWWTSRSTLHGHSINTMVAYWTSTLPWHLSQQLTNFRSMQMNQLTLRRLMADCWLSDDQESNRMSIECWQSIDGNVDWVLIDQDVNCRSSKGITADTISAHLGPCS